MEPIYYPDHAKRYAHIPKGERWKYPDELKREPFSSIKRTKPLKELTWADIDGVLSPYFYANDMPYTLGFEKY